MTERKTFAFIGRCVVMGAVVVVPLYLTAVVLFRIAETLRGLLRPFDVVFPEWFLGERLLAALIAVAVFFVIGAAVQTRPGRALAERLEKSLFQRIPGYALLRSLTQQLTREGDEHAWKPALAELEDALVPAFIIEPVEGGRLTVFVPSSPTPLAGTIYILDAKRVHPVDVPFTQAVKALSQWGHGSKHLVAAMNAAAAKKQAQTAAGPGVSS